MQLGMKKCKVCGKEYPYCKTAAAMTGGFRWQDVACCPEHGQAYMKQILESRGAQKPAAPAPAQPAPEAPRRKTRKKKNAPVQDAEEEMA